MKRKTSNVPSRIWPFRCRTQILSGAAEFNEQIQAAHNYYNNLIDIERERRRRFRELRTAMFPNFETLELAYEAVDRELEETREKIQSQRKAKRKRVVDADLNAAVRKLKEQHKQAWQDVKDARQTISKILRPADDEVKQRFEAACHAAGSTGPRVKERVRREVLTQMLQEENWPDFWKAKTKIEMETTEQIKRTRADSGLYNGTYLLVDQAFEAAKKSKKDPRHRHYTDPCRIGVQLHREPVADIISGRSKMLQIDPFPHDVEAVVRYRKTQKKKTIVLGWKKNRPGRRHMETTVRIRIGSNAGKPVWAEFRVLMHRPLPDDAAVMWAWIKISRVGTQTRYQLQLTLESGQFHETAVAGSKTLAFDFGWRLLPHGIRVVYCVDDQGNEQELALPYELRERFLQCSRLQGFADEHFERARKNLADFMKKHSVPAWVKKDTEYMMKWRQHGKLARLVGRWVSEAFPDRDVVNRLWASWKSGRLKARRDLFDAYANITNWAASQGITDETEQLLVYLEWWRHKNKHLYQWESHQRDSTLAHRHDLYRKWARRLADKYAVAVVDDIDLRKFATKCKPEEEPESEFTNRVRAIAAPSELRSIIVEAFGSRACKAEGESSTQECHICSYVNKDWEKPEERVQVCAGCGNNWDRDLNACRVMLNRYFARFGTNGSPGSARREDLENDANDVE
jgi:hypothetical protein